MRSLFVGSEKRSGKALPRPLLMPLTLLLVAGIADVTGAAEKLPMITVHAKNHAYHNALITVALPTGDQTALASASAVTIQDEDKRQETAQVSEQDGQILLTFLVEDLPQGATRTYHLNSAKNVVSKPGSGVRVQAHGDDMDVLMGADDKALFTRYTTHSGPNKPFFYPILTSDGKPFTRRWPLEETTNESHDHPHHRGLWFTHGDINGVDFWTEVPGPKTKLGTTIAGGYENVTGGPLFGAFQTRTVWRGPDKNLMATDVRSIRIYRVGQTRIMDFDIAIKPNGESLIFGDTKEGMFGLRVPDSFAPTPGKDTHIDPPTGHIESASGLKDSKVWGKPNEWVDNYGPIDGKTYGVAIFDHPQNLRHPQTWHARDYGLFTVNPFGLHDFGLGAKGAGDYTLSPDKTLTLRYRVVFHEGDTTTAQIAEQYQGYADPPEVTVK